MIYAKDALLLARTKLKLRLVRLGLTIFVSSLLFSALIFIGLVAVGSINSASSFSKEGFGNRYLVSAMPATYNYQFAEPNGNLIKLLEPVQAKLVAEKKLAAKKLNITYNPQEDETLPITENKQPNGTVEKYVNQSSPYVRDYVNKLNIEKQVLSYDSFKKTAAESGAINYFRSTTVNMFSLPSGDSPTYKVLDPKKAETPVDSMSNMGGPAKGLESLKQYGWSQFDDILLAPFLLPGQNLDVGKDGSVPIIAPFSAAEEILGLQAPPSTATTADKLKHVQDVRNGIAGKTAQVCYRNSVSAALFQKAVDQQKEIEQNKNNSEYVKPSLIYKAPAADCAPTTIKSDTRSAEEKTADANMDKFKQQFGEATEQSQKVATIRLVGLTSEPDYSASFSAVTIIQSILQSSLGTGWFLPASATKGNETATTVFGSGDFAKLPVEKVTYYAEFSTLEAAKKYMEQYSCDTQSTYGPPSEGFEACVDNGRPYRVMPFGNNAGAIDQFKNGFWKVFKYIILAAVIFATLIMMGNVGKIIADSRRETAVFRALGAKRIDISQVYITYSLLLSVMVFIVAAIIGVAGAILIDKILSPAASLGAVLAYNSSDINKQFHLFSFDVRILLGVFGLVVVSALLSTVGPLSGNLRRNPIKDMRDEG